MNIISKMLVLATVVSSTMSVNGMNKQTLYTLNGVNPNTFHVIQSNEIVQMGGIYSRSINIRSVSYNGLPLYDAISVSINSTQDEIISMLQKAFHKEVITQVLD